nr:hypothetical protein [Myxococcota bacterium]
APRLSRVDVCERSRDVWTVSVHASELLRASSLAGAVLERAGAPCTMTRLGDGAEGAGGVAFTCDTLAPEEIVRVRFPEGAIGIAGTALEGPGSAAGAPLELSRGHAFPISDSCVAAPVPLEAGVVPAFDAL